MGSGKINMELQFYYVFRVHRISFQGIVNWLIKTQGCWIIFVVAWYPYSVLFQWWSERLYLSLVPSWLRRGLFECCSYSVKVLYVQWGIPLTCQLLAVSKQLPAIRAIFENLFAQYTTCHWIMSLYKGTYMVVILFFCSLSYTMLQWIYMHIHKVAISQ